MIETKSLTVAPENENSQIELWSKFGWVVKSSQEIFSRDSHLEGRSDGVYSVTKTTNYVKILLQRDTEMKNYQALRNLEMEYDRIIDPHLKGYKPFFISVLIGLAIAFYGISESVILATIAGIIFSILSIVLIVLNSKKNKEIKEVIYNNGKRRHEILRECETLL